MLGDYAWSCGSWSLYCATGNIPMALSEAIIATLHDDPHGPIPRFTQWENCVSLPGVPGGSGNPASVAFRQRKRAFVGGQSRRVLAFAANSWASGTRDWNQKARSELWSLVGIGGLGNGRNLPPCSHAAPFSARCSNDAAPLSRSVGSQDRVVARVRRGGHVRPRLAVFRPRYHSCHCRGRRCGRCRGNHQIVPLFRARTALGSAVAALIDNGQLSYQPVDFCNRRGSDLLNERCDLPVAAPRRRTVKTEPLPGSRGTITSPPSAGHWRFGTRPRPRLARSCRRSRAALRRAQLDEFRQARLPMPGRWKRRRVQTGRNTRRMTAAQRCASQYVSRSARNRPHGTTLLAGTPRPAKKCE